MTTQNVKIKYSHEIQRPIVSSLFGQLWVENHPLITGGVIQGGAIDFLTSGCYNQDTKCRKAPRNPANWRGFEF